MADSEYICLDIRAFDNAIEKREHLISSYDEIKKEYNRIVDKLLQNWEGQGATAFELDARTVMTNISGISETLKILCDTLSDCKEIIMEADTALGEYNRNPDGAE